MPYKENLLETSMIPDAQLLLPRRGVLTFSRSDYRISDKAVAQLEAYILDLEVHPRGKRVGKINFNDDRPPLDRTKLVDSLPAGLSEEKFVKVVLLSYLVESATDSYIDVFDLSGERYGALWLPRYSHNVWGPDEYEHSDPFKWPLLYLGYSEEDLDRQAKEVKEKTYEHTSGDTPVHMTQFGEIQEHVTDFWHGLVGFIFREPAPRIAERIFRVKKRETLHSIWYKDLTAIQIADNPDLRCYAVDATDRLKMPGNKLVPELQQGSVNLIPVMGGDLRQLERGLVRLISGSLGDNTEYLGEAIIELLARKSEDLGVTPVRLAKRISEIPGLGRIVNLLAGQAVQEREGMKPKTPAEKLVWDITSPVRSLIVGRAENMNFVV